LASGSWGKIIISDLDRAYQFTLPGVKMALLSAGFQASGDDVVTIQRDIPGFLQSFSRTTPGPKTTTPGFIGIQSLRFAENNRLLVGYDRYDSCLINLQTLSVVKRFRNSNGRTYSADCLQDNYVFGCNDDWIYLS